MTAEPSEPLDLAALRRDWVELPTLGDLIVRRAAHGPETDAVVFPESRETGAALLGASLDTARSLLGLGIRPGDTVAILMPNTPDFLHVLFGCALVGVKALLVNARYKAYELAYVLENGDVAAVVTTDAVSDYVDFVPLLNEATAPRPPLLRSPDPARLVLARRVPRPRRLRGRRRRAWRPQTFGACASRCASATSRS